MSEELRNAARRDWGGIRDQVELDPAIAYLNTGTSGLITKSVHDATLVARTKLHRNPTRYVWRENWGELELSRKRVADHLKADASRLVFFTNISNAINTIAGSIELASGAEIVMSNHEYGSMKWAWEQAADRRGWSIRCVDLPRIPTSPVEIVDAFASALGSKTSVLYLSHVLYTTGMVLPVQDICRVASQHDIMTIVDGAHAPGMMPLHLDEIGASFYTANLHKWFMAPVGAAFLYASPACYDKISPIQVSWGHLQKEELETIRETKRWFEKNEFGSNPWIRQFEMEGTRDQTPWFLLSKCCDFLESIGYAAIQARHRELSDLVRSLVSNIDGVEVVTPSHDSMRGGITALRLSPTWNAQEIRAALWDLHRIEVNAIEHPDGPFLRVSTHVYNTELEVERFASALRSLLGS